MERRGNPNKERSLLLANIIFLCVITLAAIAAAAFFYLEMRSSREMLEEMNNRLSGQNGQDKTLFTDEELYAQREDARIEGEMTREQEIREQIKESLTTGSSTLATLRQLYSDEIVISSRGRYYFYEVQEDIAQNSFGPDDFIIDRDGILRYQGEAPVGTVEQGIQISARNEDIDWETLAGDQADYVMIDAGGRDADGELTENPYLGDQLQAAGKAGLSVGVTYSLRAVSKEEAQEDAEWLTDLLEPYMDIIDGYVAVAIRMPEDGDRTLRVDSDLWTENIKIVCNTLKLAGYQPVLEESATAMMTLTQPEELKDIARCAVSDGAELYFPYSFVMWRYDTSATVEGVSGTVSRSIRIDRP